MTAEPDRVLIEEISWQIGKHVEDVDNIEQRAAAARAILAYLRYVWKLEAGSVTADKTSA